MSERTAQVYVLRLGDMDYFKVGMTANINERIASLQTAIPFDIHLIATAEHVDAFAVEKDMHIALKEYRVRNEWFQCPQSEIMRVFEIISAMATVDQILDEPEPLLLQPAINERSNKNHHIVVMLNRGFSYRQIARELSVSHETIRFVARSGGSEVPLGDDQEETSL